MFQKGEYVVTSSDGVCFISDIVEKEFLKKLKSYFMLKPLLDEKAVCYIPVEGAQEKMRYVMTKEDAYKLIDEIPSIDEITVTNEKERQDIYKKCLRSDEVRERVALIKHVRRRMQTRLDEGKKVMAIDERFYKQATDLLHGELSFAMGIEASEVERIIIERVGQIN